MKEKRSFFIIVVLLVLANFIDHTFPSDIQPQKTEMQNSNFQGGNHLEFKSFEKDFNSLPDTPKLIGMANPAAVHCKELGYEYRIAKTGKGERGICVFPDGNECEEWEFLEGKCGKEYSYCLRHGYDIEIVSDGKNPFSYEYAVCIPKATSPEYYATLNERKAVTDLMNLGEKLSGSLPMDSGGEFDQNVVETVEESEFGVEAISAFDWRDKDGEDWTTPVKDQGGCGSCWAFAAVGGVEAKINIARNDSDFDVDLSEQYLVSDCFHYGSCGGGSPSVALGYIKTYGITDEPCFPYTASASSCSDRCSVWNRRLWKVDDYGYVPTGQEKNYLVEKGPLSTYIWMGGYFDGGIYRCDNPPGPNHVVLLVGYNDTGNYWIVKNSWGSSWNDDGYFKVGYEECNINEYNAPFYTELSKGPSQDLKANDTQVNTGSTAGTLNDTYYKDGNNMTLSEDCSPPDCNGLNVTFNFSTEALSNIQSMDLIAYHQARSKSDFNLYFSDGSRWRSLDSIPNSNYLMKYGICSSPSECSNYTSYGNITIKYECSSCTSCSQDHVDVDWLVIEATPQSYCSASTSSAAYEHITKVSLNGNEKNSSNSTYSDFTGTILTTLYKGSTYTLYVDAYTAANRTEYAKTWIDFNNDENFTETEEIDLGNVTFNGSHTFSKAFSVPSDVNASETRMRVYLKYNSTPSPCENASYGEIEDYEIRIFTLPEISDCSELGQSNTVYTLTQDIIGSSATKCMEITASNITLDCQGHKIDGTGSGYGVYYYPGSPTNSYHTIKNCVLTDWYTGIYFGNANYNNFINNTAENNSYSYYGGFSFEYSSNNTLTNNTAANNKMWGFYLYRSSHNTLVNNTMINNTYNIGMGYGLSDDHFDQNIDMSNLVDGKPIYYLKNVENETYDSSTNAGFFACIFCNNITVRDLNLTKNDRGMLFYKTHNSMVINNTAESNYNGGFYTHESSNNTFRNNIAENTESGGGFYIYHSSNNTLTNNTAKRGNNKGFDLLGSTNNTLINNTAENNDWCGFRLDASTDNILTNNTGQSNEYGFYICYGSNNTLTNNTAANNDDGFIFGSTSNNILTNNTANSNKYGIYLSNSDSNTIIFSYIENNIDYDIYLLGSANDNRFYRNELTSKLYISDAASDNKWNTTTPTGGNNWRMYDAESEECYDTNEDGFCDGSYEIDPDSIDYLPIFTNDTTPHHTYNCSNCSECTDVIQDQSTQGDTVKLNQSITNQDGNCIEFGGKGGITFDCQGYTIDGDGDNDGYGIYLSSVSDYNDIRNCIIKEFYYGIFLSSSHSNNLIGINVSSNTHGIRLESSSNNTLTNNTAKNNYRGVHLCSSSNYNLIYNNYLESTNNVYDNSNNYWNTTKDCSGTNIIGGDCIGGNYYSDVPLWDTDGDGIGDTPHAYYNISGGNNADYLPLTNYTENTPSNAPTLSSPAQDSVGVSTSSVLIVTVSDRNLQAMNVSFYNAADGSQIGSTQINVTSSSTANVTWAALDMGTTYEWYVNVTDGINTTESSTWNFTTRSVNVSLFDPTSNTNVTKDRFFTFIVNVSCFGLNCGEINVSLDSEKGIVNTATGAIPFYTTDDNPQTITLSVGESQPVSWRVNATGNLSSTYAFSATAFRTANANDTHTSDEVNISIGTMSVTLLFNGTEGNKSYIKGGMANITASINLTERTVVIEANFTGASTVIAQGTEVATNITDTSNLMTTYNITAYFAGDSDYSPSSTTYFLNISTLPGGSACDGSVQCTGGYCVHGICRSTSTYCGDGHCDSGETCSGCSGDCGACAEVVGGGVAGASESKTVAIITPDAPVTVIVEKSDTLKIEEIKIEVNTEIHNVKITVKESVKPAAAPEPVSAAVGGVYKYLSVSKECIKDADISKAKIKFKVEKSWIAANGIDEAKVYLNRLVDNKWVKLTTARLSEDATYVYYEAESPGLSVFSITGEKKVEKAPCPHDCCIAEANYTDKACASGYECKDNRCVEIPKPECPTCPEPSPWSDCIEERQRRTNYKCSAETNYGCQGYTEEQACEVTKPPEVIKIPTRWIIAGAVIVVALITLAVLAWKKLIRLPF